VARCNKMRAGDVLARTPSLVGYDRLTSKRRYAHYRRLRNLLAGRFAIMTRYTSRGDRTGYAASWFK
jgi:hypothetical protein